jgi:hypothetical protein
MLKKDITGSLWERTGVSSIVLINLMMPVNPKRHAHVVINHDLPEAIPLDICGLICTSIPKSLISCNKDRAVEK